MSTRKKNITADYSNDTGAVIACPLCSHRVVSDTASHAWRLLYTHLKHGHHEIHAARYAKYAQNNARNAHRNGK